MLHLSGVFKTYPGTSALAMLRHFAALKGLHGRLREEVVERLLVRTNLWEARHRSIDKFSGGMRQRYGIAQALLGDPRLIIVDEPTSGLDPAERRRFQNLLVELGKGVVVLLSTHIVDDVEDICPQIAIMGEGRILLAGDVRALIESLNGKLWVLTADRPQLDDLRPRHRVIATRIRPDGVDPFRKMADRWPENNRRAVRGR